MYIIPLGLVAAEPGYQVSVCKSGERDFRSPKPLVGSDLVDSPRASRWQLAGNKQRKRRSITVGIRSRLAGYRLPETVARLSAKDKAGQHCRLENTGLTDAERRTGAAPLHLGHMRLWGITEAYDKQRRAGVTAIRQGEEATAGGELEVI